MTSLKAEWVDQALKFCRTEADFYSGCRKILSARRVKFFNIMDDSMHMEDAGYTKSKMTMLTKNYLHVESKGVAIELWAKRKGQRKYGSVGFTTFAHFVKGGSIDAKRSKRASVFGPCIQSVVITWLSKDTYSVDVFYRTTEWLKKFPADLVFLRDVLLTGFDFTDMRCSVVTAHFANVTIHPMYFVTILPHMEHPTREMLRIKEADPYFHDWLCKWSSRYVCEEHSRGIAKFAQAQRVQMDAMKRIPPKTLKIVQEYFREHHPGYTKEYIAPEEDDE